MEKGIQPGDIYNFDETGFRIGVANSLEVFTADLPPTIQQRPNLYYTTQLAINQRWSKGLSCAHVAKEKAWQRGFQDNHQ